MSRLMQGNLGLHLQYNVLFGTLMASDIFYLQCWSFIREPRTRPWPLIVRLGAVPCPTMAWLMKMSNQKHDLMSGLGLRCQDPLELWSHHSPGTLTTDHANVGQINRCRVHIWSLRLLCVQRLFLVNYKSFYIHTPSACKAAIDSFPR